jgi:antitoxin PrlF
MKYYFWRYVMLYSAVTTKGQVTIPREIRRQLHIKAGDRVAFKIEDHHAILKRKINNIQAAFGLIKAKRGASLEDMENGIRKGASDDCG